jgi:hypothetical protein
MGETANSSGPNPSEPFHRLDHSMIRYYNATNYDPSVMGSFGVRWLQVLALKNDEWC